MGFKIAKKTINISKIVGISLITLKNKSKLLDGVKKNSQVWMSHGDTIVELSSGMEKIASTEDVEFAAYSYDDKKAYGIQFHIEIKDTTVNEWGCVPEYKSALESQLGQGALDKFDSDAKDNIQSMNKYSKILYENFKKIVN